MGSGALAALRQNSPPGGAADRHDRRSGRSLSAPSLSAGSVRTVRGGRREDRPGASAGGKRRAAPYDGGVPRADFRKDGNTSPDGPAAGNAVLRGLCVGHSRVCAGQAGALALAGGTARPAAAASAGSSARHYAGPFRAAGRFPGRAAGGSALRPADAVGAVYPGGNVCPAAASRSFVEKTEAALSAQKPSHPPAASGDGLHRPSPAAQAHHELSAALPFPDGAGSAAVVPLYRRHAGTNASQPVPQRQKLPG